MQDQTTDLGMIKSSDWLSNQIKNETNYVFGITGGVITNMFDSCQRLGLNVINTHHEQGAIFAADAYSRVSGKLGVCLCTSGPGYANFVSGIAGSYFDSVPLLIISGQVVHDHLRPNNKIRQFGFQEIDVIGISRGICNYTSQPTIKNLKLEIGRAISKAKNGRMGPSVVDLCDELQRTNIVDSMPSKPKSKKVDGKVVIDAWNKISTDIGNAERPLLIIGAGGKNKYTKEFLKSVNVPYLLTWGAIDTIENQQEFNCRDFGVASQRIGNFAIKASDLIVVLGSRMDTHESGSNINNFAVGIKKIIVDIDQNELDIKENYEKFNVNCEHLMKAFLDYNTSYGTQFSDWCRRIKSMIHKYPICPSSFSTQKKNVNPYYFFDKLSQKCGENDIVITDAGATLTWTMQGWKVKGSQRLFSMFNHSPMGYALPASIGAYCGLVEKRQYDSSVICITGDGGLQMNIQELDIISKMDAPIKIFVMNNHGYGIIKQTQDTWLKSNYVASDGPFPDILKVAKAYGLKTFKIKNHKEFSKLNKILNYNKPCMISVEVDPNEQIQPKLTFGSNLEDQTPKLPIEEQNEILTYLKG